MLICQSVRRIRSPLCAVETNRQHRLTFYDFRLTLKEDGEFPTGHAP